MNATNEDKGVKKAYKKLAGQYKKLIKDAKNETKKHEKELKKHGVKDIAARCPSHSTTHSAVHKSTANRMLPTLSLTRTPRRRHRNMNLTQTLRVTQSLPQSLIKARPKTSHCSVFDMMVIYVFDFMCPIKYLQFHIVF